MQGETIVCLGCGPSLTREDVDYCRGKADVLAVNRSYEMAPWARWLYACDASFWARYPAALSFPGERWTMTGEQPGLSRVAGKPGGGLSLESGVVFWGGTEQVGGHSGAQAIQLAYQFGARRIVLLGFDMRGTHWHEQHDGLANPDERNFAHWRDGMKVLASELAAAGVKILNCSRSTSLEIPRANLEDVL